MKNSLLFSPMRITKKKVKEPRSKFEFTAMGSAVNIPDSDHQPDESQMLSIGTDLRALRKSHQMTLTDVAEAIDRSVGYLSQVERGLSQPSISDLRQLASLFNVSISFFFGEAVSAPQEQGYIVRANERRSLGNAEDGLVEQLLSPDLGGSFEMFRSVFAPGAKLAKPVKRQTEEAGYIIAGMLKLTIGARTFTLQKGDSFRFANEAYTWENPGTEPTMVIWTISPPVY